LHKALVWITHVGPDLARYIIIIIIIAIIMIIIIFIIIIMGRGDGRARYTVSLGTIHSAAQRRVFKFSLGLEFEIFFNKIFGA